VLESLGSPVVGVDLDGRVQFVNDAAESWLGRSRQRLVGVPVESLSPNAGALRAVVEKVRESGMALHASVPHDAAELTVSASPWWQEDRPSGVILLLDAPRVVTPEQGKADIAALAAGLAHEVRNPLAALRGATELLSAELSGDVRADVKEYLELILRETARVDMLVARLLTVGRPLVLQRGDVRGDELIHDLALQAKALAKSRGIPITVEEEYDPGLPQLHADRERLFEALVNLVKNAVEALPEAGGKVRLRAGIDAKRRRTSSGMRSLLLIRIADTGPGLGTARDRLFTPFFTTKASGTGLGLLLARRVIEAHGGVLTMRDRPPPETGTEVHVLLPLEKDDG
jgi:two-component system nitrogen regulation sensor histidine kinase GlnL